jgi:adenosylcobinamide-phosphate synthase
MGPASIALLADLMMGEPQTWMHPTVWMGRWIAGSRSRRMGYAPATSFVQGAFTVAGGMLLSALAANAVSSALNRSDSSIKTVATGIALKPAMSLRSLLAAASQVQVALRQGDLTNARRLLAYHLVSRETSDLSSSEIAGATIESISENLSDSVVAPLLAFRLGGLSWAYMYRMINTADAMLGYHTPELEWFGKAAARADDIVNILPARCSALLIACTASIGGGSSRMALRVAIRDAGATSSPNAGWPMAAMAGALGVRLVKRDCYALNSAGRDPRAADIGRARRIVISAATLSAAMIDLS